MGNEDNGSGGDRLNGVQRLSISYNPHTRQGHIDFGDLPLDEVLVMLERARLELDARYRFVRARELLAEQVAQLQTQALVQNAMRDPRIKA